MRKNNEIVGLVVNVLIMAVVLCLVIIGLNRIGLYSLPPAIEKLLGTAEINDGGENVVDDSKVYESLPSSSKTKPTVETAHLTYENARNYLEKVTTANNYYHEIKKVSDYNGVPVTEYVVMERKNGLFTADIYDGDRVPVKSIVETDNSYVITYYHDFQEDTAELPKGSFSIEDECGIILDQSYFLKSDYILENSDFYIENGKYGAVMTISFRQEYESLVQTQTFKILVDNGIVIDAQSIENDVNVFSMTTENFKLTAN